MDIIINNSVEDREKAFVIASDAMNYPAFIIEKDFWVCVILRELFSMPDIGEKLIFRGGTSLSKAHKIMERFSEDIDLTIGREHIGFEGKLSSNRQSKLKKRCKLEVQENIKPKLEESLANLIPDDQKWSLEVDEKDGSCLLFYYPIVVAEHENDYIQSRVKIEMGARGDSEPSDTRPVRAYVGDLEALKDDESFTTHVKVIDPLRTFFEKICAIHEENTRERDVSEYMSRHYYDVARIIQKGLCDDWDRNREILDGVIAQRRWAFPSRWVDYDEMLKGNLDLEPNETKYEEWSKDYEKMKVVMFANTPPDFDEVVKVVVEFANKMTSAL